MTTRGEAIEAMVDEMERRIPASLDDMMRFQRHDVDPDESRRWKRQQAERYLDAALAVLHPTVPNDTHALDALPVGTVLMESGTGLVIQRQSTTWNEPGDELGGGSGYYATLGYVTEWTVIYQPEED